MGTNMPSLEHELVTTGYLDDMYWVLKECCFGLGNVELLETGYLDHLCQVSKA